MKDKPPKSEFSPDPQPEPDRLPIDPPRYATEQRDARDLRAIRDRIVARSAARRS